MQCRCFAGWAWLPGARWPGGREREGGKKEGRALWRALPGKAEPLWGMA